VLLSADFRAQLERLNLRARRRVRAQYAGRHASAAKGESLDFADYREYVPGDDFRRIDHNLWARLGQVLVRQFEAEEELVVRLVMDVSTSMTFHGKLDTARRLAAMITYLALAGGDRVIPAVVPGPGGSITVAGPTGRHLSAWPQLESWLEWAPAGGSVPLAVALRSIVGGARSRGAVILVSDLLDPEWERALDRLVTGAGGLILHVLGREELEPELVGDLEMRDSESGRRLAISTSDETLAAYRAAMEAFVEAAAGRARRAGLDYLLVPAGAGAPERALAALVAAEVTG
jgi:uncharacterized protein (DUF58 family)